jgi:signal transduction histidine kinase
MGEMASSLAHEINQPLAAISNYVSGLTARLRDRALKGQSMDREQLIDALAKTGRQAERAAEVIRRIRGFVRRSEPSRESCEVRTIIADAVGLAEIDAGRHRIRIVVEPLIDLPNVWADPILIAQVLLNLMKNAIEAMRSDGQSLQLPRDLSLRLAVSVVGHQLEFMVADTGPGVSQALQDRLFEPFYTTKSEGMGMGLNICRTIVEFHEGRLWVEPAEPTGCVFRFTLPLAEAYQEIEESMRVAL